uniref:Uncharacterized protein n=1 Tax=Cacopsylla melanoneura TaxID=428564 RepID=A0A8D9DMU2_9HEMI
MMNLIHTIIQLTLALGRWRMTIKCNTLMTMKMMMTMKEKQVIQYLRPIPYQPNHQDKQFKNHLAEAVERDPCPPVEWPQSASGAACSRKSVTCARASFPTRAICVSI